MAILKRIGPASAFKVGLVSHALVGSIAGAFCSLIRVDRGNKRMRATMSGFPVR